jgi:hypothetical protein
LCSETCPNANPQTVVAPKYLRFDSLALARSSISQISALAVVINFKETIQTKNMSVFDKVDYKTVPTKFRTFGIISLEELSKFQERFKMHDTNTTIILLEMVLL